MDKLKMYIVNNKKMIIFLLTLIIIGIVAGSLFSVIISGDDKNLVKESMNSFFTSIKENNINYYQTFVNSFLNNLLFMIIIWLLGISIIGLPIILFMYFSKAFSLGFLLASLISNYNMKGILYTICFLPAQLLFFVAASLLMIYAVTLSLKLFSSIVKKKTIDFKHIINKYLFILLITMILLFITSLLETFVLPNILKIFI